MRFTGLLPARRTMLGLLGESISQACTVLPYVRTFVVVVVVSGGRSFKYSLLPVAEWTRNTLYVHTQNICSFHMHGQVSSRFVFASRLPIARKQNIVEKVIFLWM